MELTPARQAGCDAIEPRNGQAWCLQIKGRVILPGAKPGHRGGRIDITKAGDSALLVLLDQDFEAVAIYEADRTAMAAARGAWLACPKRAWSTWGEQVPRHRDIAVEGPDPTLAMHRSATLRCMPFGANR